MISKKMMDKLKEHAKLHKGGMMSRHMKNMKRFIEEGDTFAKAHKKAVELDKKASKKKKIPKSISY